MTISNKDKSKTQQPKIRHTAGHVVASGSAQAAELVQQLVTEDAAVRLPEQPVAEPVAVAPAEESTVKEKMAEVASVLDAVAKAKETAQPYAFVGVLDKRTSAAISESGVAKLKKLLPWNKKHYSIGVEMELCTPDGEPTGVTLCHVERVYHSDAAAVKKATKEQKSAMDTYLALIGLGTKVAGKLGGEPATNFLDKEFGKVKKAFEEGYAPA